MFTPGMAAGEPLHVLSALENPSPLWQTDIAAARRQPSRCRAAIGVALEGDASVLMITAGWANGEWFVTSGDVPPFGAAAETNNVYEAEKLDPFLQRVRHRAVIALRPGVVGKGASLCDLLERARFDAQDYVIISEALDELKDHQARCADVRVGLIVETKASFNEALQSLEGRDDVRVDFIAAPEAILEPAQLGDAWHTRTPVIVLYVTDGSRVREWLEFPAVAGVFVRADAVQAREVNTG